MNPAAKRGIDVLAYVISGVAVAGGAVYGVRHLGSSAAPPSAAIAAAMQPADSTGQTVIVTPPAPVPTPPVPAPVTTVQPAPVPPVPLPPQPAVSAQDKATFFALQRNCYDAAANNQNGEYPALQAAACNRYLQFANERGWDTGTLPAYGQAAPQRQAAQDYAEAPAPADSQVIVVEQPYTYQHYRDLPPTHQVSHSQPAAPPPGVTMRINRPASGAARPPQQ